MASADFVRCRDLTCRWPGYDHPASECDLDPYANDLLTGQQAQRATAIVREKLDAIVARQQDQDRKRVLDGIPLGTPQVVEKIEKLSPERLRAVFNLLMTVTVAPVGKGGHVFNEKRVTVKWR